MFARPARAPPRWAVKRGAKTTAAHSQIDAPRGPAAPCDLREPPRTRAREQRQRRQRLQDGQARVRRRQRERRMPRQRRDGADGPGRDGGRRREAVGIALSGCSGACGVPAGRALARAGRRRREGLCVRGEEQYERARCMACVGTPDTPPQTPKLSQSDPPPKKPKKCKKNNAPILNPNDRVYPLSSDVVFDIRESRWRIICH